MTGKFLKSFILVLFAYAAVVLLFSYMPLNPIIKPFFLVIALALATALAFKIIDIQYPVPAALTAAEVKAFFTSKIFWGALLMFVFAVVDGLFDIGLGEDQATEIISLDWTNIAQAVISTVIIVLRKVDVFKVIK